MLFSDTIAYLDCSLGCSEEMLLAALFDAGLLPATLQSAIASLSLSVSIMNEQVTISGLRGTHISFIGRTNSQINISEISERLASSTLLPQIQLTVQAILHRFVVAQAKVTHTHEKDVYLDEKLFAYCVAIVQGLEELRIATLYVSPLPLVSIESLEVSKGIMQQVSLEILRQREALWKPSTREHGLVTPISAALLERLATFESPTLTINRVGYGVKCIDQPQQAHVSYVSLSLGENAKVFKELEGVTTDNVTMLSSNIDNMEGELLGGLMARLLELGALDVSFTSIQMKKNRPATLVTVICTHEKEGLLAATLLRETSTLGVRTERVKRYLAEREQQLVETPFGAVLMKVKRLYGHVVSVRPEYEECQRIAREQRIPLLDVYRVLLSVAQQHFPTSIIDKSREKES